jgi:hypothetical protein
MGGLDREAENDAELGGSCAWAGTRRGLVSHLRCSGLGFDAFPALRAGLSCGAPTALKKFENKGRGNQLESVSGGLFQRTGGGDGTSLPEADRSVSPRLREEAEEADDEVVA